MVRWDNESEDEQGDDVEEGNSPEDLLGGLWEGLAGVGSFSSGKTDQLSSTESERSIDEDGAESLESIAGSTGVAPVLCANVTTGISWDTTTVNDDTQEDETNDGNDLDQTKHEFDLTVTTNTEDVDDNDKNKEDGDPDTDVDGVFHVISPESNCDTSSSKFEGKYD